MTTEIIMGEIGRWTKVWGSVKPGYLGLKNRKEFHVFNGRLAEEADALDIYRAMKPRRRASLPAISLAWGREALEDSV